MPLLSMVTCLLWWIVLGTLLGWLASWLVGRGARAALTPVERVIEKPVDNPAHLDRIAALEQEAAAAEALRERVRALEAAPTATVEKIVEVPIERVVPDTTAPGAREREAAYWRERAGEFEQQLAVQRRRASELEGEVLRLQPPAFDSEAARAAGFVPGGPDDLTLVAGVDAKVATLLTAGGVATLHELAQSAPARLRAILAEGGSELRAIDPDAWPEQALLATRNHWRALKSLQETLVAGARVDRERERADIQARVRSLQNRLAECETKLAQLEAPPPLDHGAARAAGFDVKHDGEFEIIKGVGAAIAALLRDAGIESFGALAQLTPAQIREVLRRGGPGVGLIDPHSWADQALLAANNRWTTLAALQAVLAAPRSR